MKIVAGLGRIDNYTDYVKCGADEVFIGFVPEEWQLKYGNNLPLNRREVNFVNVNIGSYSELEILSAMTKKYKAPVTVAFNGLHFAEENYPEIANILGNVLELGFDSVIIADIGLLIYLKKIGLTEKLKIHLSGEFGEINHFIVNEIAELGVKRIIFHRKVSLKNMEKIIRQSVKNMEYEAFILNENCHFNGAFCNSLHNDELVPMCRMPYWIDTELKDITSQKEFDYDYGLCYIDKMKTVGVTHLKIVGRGADPDYIKECIKEVKRRI